MNRHAHPSRTPRTKSAFTLIEMVVSLSVISIIFLAMGSVMVLASKAIPSSDDATLLTADANDVLQQLVSEFQTATEIANMTGSVIMFKVPDRDSDGSDELLAYSWAGTPGDPLLRNYNGGAAVTVIPSLNEFSLIYDTYEASPPSDTTQSAEIELISCDSSIQLNNVVVEDVIFWGQYFKPTLPAEAIEWSVTRVMFMAKECDDVLMAVKLCLPIADDSQPSSTVVDSIDFDTSVLTNQNVWYECSFTNAVSLSPDTGLYLTFSSDAADPAKLRYQKMDVTAPNIGLAEGSPPWAWSNSDATKSLLFYVYGTYTTEEPAVAVNLVRSITINANPGATAASRIRTSITLLNQPEVP